MLQTTPVLRQFNYGGRLLPDPDPQMSVDDVRSFYVGIYPDLTNAAVEGGDFVGDAQVWTFKRGVGTKG